MSERNNSEELSFFSLSREQRTQIQCTGNFANLLMLIPSDRCIPLISK